MAGGGRRKIMRIVVREVIKQPGDPFEEGQKVYELISPVLARGEEMEVDFEGVQFMSALFLSAAIGQLLKDHALERVKALLRVKNLDELYRDDVDVVIERASLYCTNPRYREAMDRFMAQMFEDQ
jgi:hypothetical protein